MVTAVVVRTPVVVTVKVALVAPAGTVTLAGVVAKELLSDRVTTTPAGGAAPFSVAVPIEEFPPAMVDGFMARLKRAGGLMVRVVV
jgi:hypothetical protein